MLAESVMHRTERFYGFYRAARMAFALFLS